MTVWGDLLHDSKGKLARFCTRPGFGMARRTSVSLSAFHFRQIVRGGYKCVNRLNQLRWVECREFIEFSLS